MQQRRGRTGRRGLFIAAAVLLLVLILLVRCRANLPEAVQLSRGDTLLIPAAALTGDAAFFAVEVDGYFLGIIALQDRSGQLRAALDLCPMCGDALSWAQSGSQMICQNCGARWPLDRLGESGLGPWPLLCQKESDGPLALSYDLLRQAKEQFYRQ